MKKLQSDVTSVTVFDHNIIVNQNEKCNRAIQIQKSMLCKIYQTILRYDFNKRSYKVFRDGFVAFTKVELYAHESNTYLFSW